MPKRDCLHREHERHKQAFEIYYGLGPKRTYQQVAQQLGLSLSGIRLMARSFDWAKRVEQRDAAIARQAAEQVVGPAVARLARKRKLLDVAVLQTAKAIANGEVKPTIADLDKLLRLEAFLEGGLPELTPELLGRYSNYEVEAAYRGWFAAKPEAEQEALIAAAHKRSGLAPDGSRPASQTAAPKRQN